LRFNTHRGSLIDDRLAYFKHRIVTSCKTILKIGRTSQTPTHSRLIHGCILRDGQGTMQRKNV
jgi:hypothetical protein